MANQKISALTNYTPPLDADVVPVVDTANTTTKKTTWANIKATLKTYFDTLYPTLTSSTTAGTFTFDGSGGTSSSVTLRYQRVGDWVTLFIPAVTATTGTNSSQFNFSGVLDSFARPLTADTQIIFAPVGNNGGALQYPGIILVRTTGAVRIYRDTVATNFTNSSVCGLQEATKVTYYVGTGS